MIFHFVQYQILICNNYHIHLFENNEEVNKIKAQQNFLFFQQTPLFFHHVMQNLNTIKLNLIERK
jgi:hypothetical protein